MYKNVKVIAMDLDGTITNHKTQISVEHAKVLENLAKKYKLLMVGAGQARRIFNQLEKFPIDIIGNYGMQYCEYDSSICDLKIVRDLALPIDKISVEKRINQLREKFNFTEYAGETVEFHPSGCVTFPILGTKAKQEDKLAFDPDRTKRRKIHEIVKQTFPEYTVFVGGSSSFDMVPKPYDKRYALELYCKQYGYKMEEICFIGDDYGLGGNDEPVYKSNAKYLTIDDYRDFAKVTKVLL